MESKKIKSLLLSSILTTSLLEGCQFHLAKDNETPLFNDYSIVDLFHKIQIPLYLKSQISTPTTSITDLSFIGSLSLKISSSTVEEDLDWINYCRNLTDLTLLVPHGAEPALKGIKKIPSLVNLSIRNVEDEKELCYLEKEQLNFIKSSKKLESFSVENFYLEEGLIEMFSQIKRISFDTTKDSLISNYKIDYPKLSSLEEMHIIRPYTTLIHMDTNEILKLKEQGVKIYCKHLKEGEDITDDLLLLNEQIDQIVDFIHFEENDYYIDTIKKAITYIIDSFSYTEETDLSKEKAYSLFYLQGYLYGVFNNDKAICGNYAAFLSTLLDRNNIDSYVAVCPEHAFNIVKIDNLFFVIDPTLIDSCYDEDNSFTFSNHRIIDSNGNKVNIFNALHFNYNNIPEIKIDNLEINFLMKLIAVGVLVDTSLFAGMIKMEIEEHQKKKNKELMKKKDRNYY